MNDQETMSVRYGEEIDTDRLSEFLTQRLGSPTGKIEPEQFPAGSSNLTYLIRLGRDEFVLRRPPFGNTVKTAHDMRREFEVLSKLSKVYSPAPKPVLFCDDESVIGSEFYLMERRHGLVLRGTLPTPFVSTKSSPPYESGAPAAASASGVDVGGVAAVSAGGLVLSKARDICRSFICNLADLHSIDYNAAGLVGLGKPDGYCRRQVEGWTKRYFASKTHEHIELELAIQWLNAKIPDEFGASIIHNDYKFDNVMLDPKDLTKITAVLDWEMVTTGDPLMDLGTTLGYWMSPDAGDEMLNMPFNPRVLMENISRKDLIDMYSEATSRDLPQMLYYYVFGTVKIAVICQQIYARFVNGFTKDERFNNFDNFVNLLGKIANRAVDRGSI